MQLDLAEKELVAIGASVGAGCRPCIEHHIPAARDAGLSEPELAVAVSRALAVRGQATAIFEARLAELLRGVPAAPVPPAAEASRAGELVALGASVGANSHPLLLRHMAGALELGLAASQIESALKTAEFVQRRAAEMTADLAVASLEGETSTRKEQRHDAQVNRLP